LIPDKLIQHLTGEAEVIASVSVKANAAAQKTIALDSTLAHSITRKLVQHLAAAIVVKRVIDAVIAETAAKYLHIW
jgi:hypothetical protein